jgi:hypothetical protein
VKTGRQLKANQENKNENRSGFFNLSFDVLNMFDINSFIFYRLA